MSLLKYLVDGEFTQKQNWSELTGELRGQFGLLAMSGSMQRIYYAVKAKPLYLLFDSLNRGIVVASSREALNGLYHPVRNPQPVELEPYSSGVISPDGILEKFSRSLVQGAGSIVLSGGGLDSLVAAYNTRINHPDEPLSLLYFDYLAKAGRKEVEATRAIGEGVIGLTGTGAVSCHFFDGAVLTALADSSLTGSREISHGPVSGHASEWVPARNTVLMSLAIAFAEQNGFARIITGINQDAATAYPDNDEEWLLRMQQVVPFAVASGQSIALEAPLVRMSKVEIVKHGKKLGIPWKDVRSWSCYEEGERHCGECSSCSARRKAFKLARVADPTEYAK
jgi:7-cyano-7-deazaguanine synthase